MVLQVARWNSFRNPSLGQSSDDGRFMFTQCNQQDFPSFLDRAHSHGDGLSGNIGFTKKIAGRCSSGHWVQRAKSSSTIPNAKGFIGADMSVAANPQQHHIDTTRLSYRLFIVPTMLINILGRDCSIRNMDGLSWNVDVVEEIILHPPVVTLKLIFRQPVILHQIEGFNFGKVQAFLLVKSDQLPVNADGR